MKVVSYIRVSKSEQHPENQSEPIKRFCESMDYTLVKEYTERGVSGRVNPTERSVMVNLLWNSDIIDETGIKGIVVWKLDRLSRNLEDLISLRKYLDRKGIQIISATENIETKTAGGRFAYHLFGAMAEYESDRLSERTKIGLDRKIQEGGVLGKPIPPERKQRILDVFLEENSLRETARKTGEAYSTVRNTIKEVENGN